jgi:hypothetical protein
MDQSGIYGFMNHPLYAKISKIKPSDIDRIQNQNQWDQFAQELMQEVKASIEATINAKVTNTPNSPPQKDYTAQLNQIMTEIKKIKSQKLPLNRLKKLLKNKLATVDQLKLIHIASIIIRVKGNGLNLPQHFAARIKFKGKCPECPITSINATNLRRIDKMEDFEMLAQEETYHIPLQINGTLSTQQGKWHIRISKDDFKKILFVDHSSLTAGGKIISSVKTPIDEGLYPRILVHIRD